MSIIESTSALLLRLLPSDQFLKLRKGYLRVKSRTAPVLRLYYGNFNTAELIENVDQHLDSDWSILMVHSSVNNLAPMYDGNTTELLNALIEYCGPKRTLVMPTFNFGQQGSGAREMLKKDPRFDLRRSPSQMGLLTELFRRSRSVIQSKHPIYRIAALGPLAESVTRGHEGIPSGMGQGSPFDFMAIHNAQILGVGKPFQVMTQAHHVESLLGEDWPAPVETLPDLQVTVVDKDDEISMKVSGRQQQWRFNIWKLREILTKDQLKEWRYHNCPMFAARAGIVTDALVTAAKRGFTLYDPVSQ
ncbi:MAG: AAC(3) family N-acetyltransferase [Halioglobus sp.]|nr:AAC(3) family N-acetyltransferase [Halioglobus sp.]